MRCARSTGGWACQQARVLRAMVEVTRARPRSGEWAAGEIGAALALTSVAADRELGFAETVVNRLPLLFAALLAGELDRAKAWVFADHLDDVSAEQVEVICQALVPGASGLTTGQLRARLLRLLHEVDPDHARRRYRRAVRERAVVGYLAPDGTATVTASGLPADEAAVACERLDALAAAAQRAGHPGRLWQIQADLFLGMLDGRFHQLTERQIVAALFARTRPEDAEPPDDPDGVSEPAGVTEPTSRAESAGAAEELVGHVRMGVEVRVGLLTLLGLDERCGEVAGLGPVLPHVARRLVAAQHRGAQWRFAELDQDGHLMTDGLTRRRPRPDAAAPGECRGGVVELHVGADELAELVRHAADHGPWAALIADRAAQHAARLAGTAPTPGARRFARGSLARHVEMRDRTCSFVGCRRPARRADKDHTRDHAAGGPTSRANTGPLCEHHHRLKTEGWWTLRQPAPGHFEWTSPLGRIYRTRGEPIRPPTVPARPRPPTPVPGPSMRFAGPILRRPAPRRRICRTVGPPDDPPF